MSKKKDYEALYSPNGRQGALEAYRTGWPVAESAKYYQLQVSRLELLNDRQVRRRAYQVQLGQAVESDYEIALWAESPQDDDFLRLKSIYEAGQNAKDEIVVAHLRMVAHIARLTMGWVPYGSNGYKNSSQNGDVESEEDEMLPARQFESIFKGSIVRDLSVFKAAPLPLEDRIQAGTIGLIRAAEKYNPGSNAKFTTYAWTWVESKIINAIGENKVISIPINNVHMLRKVQAVKDKLTQELGRSPTRDELREATGHISGVNMLNDAQNADALASLDEMDRRIYDRTDLSQQEIVEQIMREDALDDAMQKMLPEKERDVLAMRYGFVGGQPMTLEEIGSQLGLTRERVRQIEIHSLGRLAAIRALFG